MPLLSALKKALTETSYMTSILLATPKGRGMLCTAQPTLTL